MFEEILGSIEIFLPQDLLFNPGCNTNRCASLKHLLTTSNSRPRSLHVLPLLHRHQPPVLTYASHVRELRPPSRCTCSSFRLGQSRSVRHLPPRTPEGAEWRSELHNLPTARDYQCWPQVLPQDSEREDKERALVQEWRAMSCRWMLVLLQVGLAASEITVQLSFAYELHGAETSNARWEVRCERGQVRNTTTSLQNAGVIVVS